MPNRSASRPSESCSTPSSSTSVAAAFMTLARSNLALGDMLLCLCLFRQIAFHHPNSALHLCHRLFEHATMSNAQSGRLECQQLACALQTQRLVPCRQRNKWETPLDGPRNSNST